MIDNYDSFTYNIVYYFKELGKKVIVFRNDEITIKQIKKINPKYICLSPGPGRPIDAGICIEVIINLGKYFPILGVCLGHQAIGEAFGAKIITAKKIMHGKISKIIHNGSGIFKNIPNYYNVVRYHSLAIDRKFLPNCLKIISITNDGEIMAIKHKKYNLYGVQFHPESILSQYGHFLLQNFLYLK